MPKEIYLQDKIIGVNHPTFIIAEVGVNHNGDMELAKQLVCEAKRCGADCVKFQTFKAERVVTEDAPKAEYQRKTTDPEESQAEMLKKLELGQDVYKELILLCREQNIIFMSTPYNVEDVDFLDELGVPAFKLASICIAEPYLLKYVARKGKPMIVSTGMATLAEVDDAVRAIRETGNEQLILLQCTTNYPSCLEDANLRAMETMQNALDVLIGYSDHTQDDKACIASVALGAVLVEKHFTLDKTLPGPDQSSSADTKEFARLAKNIRKTEKVLGTTRKEPCDGEKGNILAMRRSIVAKQNISKGTRISEEMLTFKRPASGLLPKFFFDLIGCIALQDIELDQPITWKMLGSKYELDDN